MDLHRVRRSNGPVGFFVVFGMMMAWMVSAGFALSAGPTAAIYTPANTMKIAPYTALFSGLDSTEIVRYDWNFHDSKSADASTDEGQLVAHRFDNGGTYTISLTVTDANGQTDSTTTQVTVEDFSGTTYYVSYSDGSDNNDGLSSSSAWKTLTYAFDNMGGSQNNPNKLLLKRGDTWTSSGHLSPPKPSILDAYGDEAGPRPKINFTQRNKGLGWGDPSDWGYSPIVNNIHLYHDTPRKTAAIVTTKVNGTVLRNCKLENGGVLAQNRARGEYQQGLVVEDCEITAGRTQGIFFYGGGTSEGGDIVLRRTQIRACGSDPILDHQIYWSHGVNWLVEDCLFDGEVTSSGAANNVACKLRQGDGIVVRRCEATDTRNGLSAGSNNVDEWATTNVVFEDCVTHHNGYRNQSAAFYISWVGKVTIRNCVIHNNHPAPDYGGAALNFASTYTTSDVRVLNNTFYANKLPCVRVREGGHVIKLRNNVFYRDDTEWKGGFTRFSAQANQLPNYDSDYNCFYWTGKSDTDDTFAVGSGGGYTDTSFQEWQSTYGQDANSTYADPKFIADANLDLRLQSDSPARDSGTNLAQVFFDMDDPKGILHGTVYDCVSRPQGSYWDMGAFEYQSGGNQ